MIQRRGQEEYWHSTCPALTSKDAELGTLRKELEVIVTF